MDAITSNNAITCNLNIFLFKKSIMEEISATIPYYYENSCKIYSAAEPEIHAIASYTAKPLYHFKSV